MDLGLDESEIGEIKKDCKIANEILLKERKKAMEFAGVQLCSDAILAEHKGKEIDEARASDERQLQGGKPVRKRRQRVYKKNKVTKEMIIIEERS